MRDYSDLRAKAEAATPGEWYINEIPSADAYGRTYSVSMGNDCMHDETYYPCAPEINNARYIAAASPQTILALLDELEALRAKPKRVKTTHDDSLFAGIDPQVAADFKAMRTKQRASVTPTAMAGIRREADKAGMTLEQALTVCCERNWRGFKAEWIERATPIVRQSVNDDAKRRLFGGFDEFGSTDAPR